MSVEFTVNTSNRVIKDLDAILNSWADTYQLLHAVQIKIKKFDSPDNYYIFGSGSIRGFSLTFTSSLLKGGHINVRLTIMASLADWRMCNSLMYGLVEKYKASVVTEDGRKLALDSLGGEAAQQRGIEQIRSDFQMLLYLLTEEHHLNFTLTNPWFDLTITRDQIEEFVKSGADVTVFESGLAAEAAVLGLCRLANLIQLKDGTTLNALGPEPALYEKSDYVVVPTSQPPARNHEELHFIEFEKFLEILGNRARRVQQYPARYYVSEINLDDEPTRQLYDVLLESCQDKLPGSV
jgi:hypothetical protein